jgi:hypothetical protein
MLSPHNKIQWELNMRENKIKLAVFLSVFGIFAEAKAQVVRPADVSISMGLVPVYELSKQGGCPYLLAAPSPQWYHLSYKKCPNDTPIAITDSMNKLNINEFMRNVCNENIRANNGCDAELIVEFPDMSPAFPSIDSDDI